MSRNAESENMKIISLDSKRDPHPKREERLKATLCAPQSADEMQRMMRQCHQDPNIRAAELQGNAPRSLRLG